MMDKNTLMKIRLFFINNVIPAKAGIHTPQRQQFILGSLLKFHHQGLWIPFFNGMTVVVYLIYQCDMKVLIHN